jgi:hypothetical protein
LAEDASAITLSRAGPGPDGGLMGNSNPTLTRLAGRPLGTPSPSVRRSPAADTLQLARGLPVDPMNNRIELTTSMAAMTVYRMSTAPRSRWVPRYHAAATIQRLPLPLAHPPTLHCQMRTIELISAETTRSAVKIIG